MTISQPINPSLGAAGGLLDVDVALFSTLQPPVKGVLAPSYRAALARALARPAMAAAAAGGGGPLFSASASSG